MTISISTILYYAIPIIIIYCFWYYIVLTTSEKRKYYDIEDEPCFAVILTAICSFLYFNIINGTLKFAW